MGVGSRILWPLLALELAAAPWAAAAVQGSFGSETLIRWYQQEKTDGDKKTAVPVYEYLRADLGNLDAEGLSAHVYGWGRYDFGGLFDPAAEGELLYGYVQYAKAAGNFLARAGRQWLAEGGANETLDGVRVAGDVTPYLTLSGFAGQPVELEVADGRSGDLVWGGRVAQRVASYYEVGVSYKRAENDRSRAEAFLAVDATATVPGILAASGFARRDVGSGVWAEQSLEASFSVAGVSARPYFQRFDHGAFFDRGEVTPKPFRPLRDSEETVTALGADFSYALPVGLDITAKIKHYDYRDAGEDAWYLSGFARLQRPKLPEFGAELGRMNGDADEDRYTLARGYAYWEAGPHFLTAEVLVASYDEEINGKKKSIFASLGGGTRFLKNALKVGVSADYSADPYFDRDWRGMAKVDYQFGFK